MSISTLSSEQANEDHGQHSVVMRRPAAGVILALIFVVIATISVWTVPLSSSMAYDESSRQTELSRTTLPEVSGALTAAVVTSIPLLAVAIPFIWPRLRTASGVILLVFSLVGAMSIGLLYLPAALALLFRKPSNIYVQK
jgi:hypothetical protein